MAKCWCGKTFKGALAGFFLAQHQKKAHPRSPNNL